jgi:hypothetical protein
VVRKLDISQAHADVRGVVHQPLAVDHSLLRVSHVRDATGPHSPGNTAARKPKVQLCRSSNQVTIRPPRRRQPRREAHNDRKPATVFRITALPRPPARSVCEALLRGIGPG